MLDANVNVPVEKDSDDFLMLEGLAKTKLSELQARNSGSVLSHILTHVRYSMLNTQLSFYGWAIKRNGTMFPVRLRGETQDLRPIIENDCMYNSAEACREKARRAYVQTGKVIDPQSGRELPLSEKLNRPGFAGDC